MIARWVAGVTKVRAKARTSTGLQMTGETAKIVRYDCEGFYHVEVLDGPRKGKQLICHEEDLEDA